MLLNRSMLPVAALGVLLTALPTATVMGQWSDLDGVKQGPAVESFLTELHMAGEGHRRSAAGLGARVMWNAASLLDRSSSLASQTELGLYGTYVPNQGVYGADTFTAYRFGVAGDVRLLSRPLADRLDPFLSLGTGLWHSATTISAINVSPLLRKHVTTLRQSVTAMEVTPGAGLRVPVGAAAVQAAVYDGTLLRSPTHHAVTLGLGLRFGF